MKIGAENKKKVSLMAVLLAVAVFLAMNSFSLLRNPQASVQQAASALDSTRGKTSKLRGVTLDPTLHRQNLISGDKNDYTGARRNIFVDEPLVSPIKIEKTIFSPRINSDPQLPAHPPIPLAFYDFTTQSGKPKKAFLQGTDIFIAGEGDVVDRRYRILKITNQFVLVEDVLSDYQQTINLTPSQAG